MRQGRGWGPAPFLKWAICRGLLPTFLFTLNGETPTPLVETPLPPICFLDGLEERESLPSFHLLCLSLSLFLSSSFFTSLSFPPLSLSNEEEESIHFYRTQFSYTLDIKKLYSTCYTTKTQELYLMPKERANHPSFAKLSLFCVVLCRLFQYFINCYKSQLKGLKRRNKPNTPKTTIQVTNNSL